MILDHLNEQVVLLIAQGVPFYDYYHFQSIKEGVVGQSLILNVKIKFFEALVFASFLCTISWKGAWGEKRRIFHNGVAIPIFHH